MRVSLPRWTGDTEPGPRACSAILAAIVVVAAIVFTIRASGKILWFDEIFTAVISQTSGPRGVWTALQHAVDGNPPLYYLANQLTRQLTANELVALRLPSIFGVLLAVVCLYTFLRRRVSHLAALAGATFLLTTQAATYATTEARPYGLLLGCAAASLLAWQSAGQSRRHAVLLALTLAACVSVHYYAILIWPAFVLAELTVVVHSRRFRPSVWVAIIAGLTPLIAFSPLLLQFRAHYGSHFWARPGIFQMITGPSLLYNFGDYWGFLFTVGLTAFFTVLAGRAAFQPVRVSNNHPPPHVFTPGEIVLTLTLLWLPAYAVIAAKLGNGGLVERYTMPAVLGAALSIGCLADRIYFRWKALLVCLFCGHLALASLNGLTGALAGESSRPRTASAAETFALVSSLDPDKLPIVISNGLQYLPLFYYGGQEARERLFALHDGPNAIQYAGSDSVELALQALQRYLPMNFVEFSAFRAQHRDFILVSENGARFDWWPDRLSQEGHQIQLLSQSRTIRVYRVTLKP
jgi:hypothetical protein